MPTDRDSASATTPNKLEVVRLEDRLNPVGVPTADALLSFAPNPVLDLGTTPTRQLGSDDLALVSTTTAADTAPTAPVLVPNAYELVVPTVSAEAVTADSSGGAFALLNVIPGQASLSGFVYVDEGAGGGVRDDGVKQAGEPGIQGATVTLLRVINGETLTFGATTTDGTGFYQFINLPTSGEYRVIETQPAGFVDGKDAAGTVNGVTRGTAGNDNIVGIVLAAGENSVNNNFGELVRADARLSGFVYVDEGVNGVGRDDGIKQAGEAPIAGVTVALLRLIDGAFTSIARTTTNNLGFYEFTGLPAGTYEVREEQPAGFRDGLDTPGSTGGTATQLADRITGIPLANGQNSENNNFGELLPLPLLGRLNGRVYEDDNNDGVRDPGELGIGGVTIVLFRVENGVTTSISQTTTTGVGFYEFQDLPAGTYEVREAQPAEYLDGLDTPGTTGGVAPQNDRLLSIPLAAGGESLNNNFGERKGSISGFVYVDEGAGGGVRDDGVKQPGEAPIAGVSVRLLRNGVQVATTVTAGDGSYRFDNLLLGGGYTVEEVTQPAGFDDGKDTAGTPGGGTAGNEVIANITLSQANPNSPNNNFGELLPASARLSGFVYIDEGAGGGTRDDGIKQPNEQGIAGVTVSLFRVVNGQTNFVTQSLTNGVGFYEFTNLPAGTYEVREVQPAGFDDGKDTPGSTGGTAPQNDRLVTIPLAVNQNSQNNNFGELVPRGALSGFVYVDEGANGGTRDDGIKQPGETPIAGATVSLFRVVNGQTNFLSQTVTDGTGFYRFTDLTPGGGYLVREEQPAGFDDGKDTPGSTGGVVTNDQIAFIVVPANDESRENNFGELLVPSARLSGFVYVDEGAGGGTRDDGIKQAGEPGIAGVTVSLWRVVNGVTDFFRETVTNGVGFYEFANLPAGTYEVREVQPAGFDDGKDTPGSTGGTAPQNDRLVTIPLAFNQNSQNNNFGELVQVGRLSGFVYEDLNDNGIKDPNEPGIAGVAVGISGRLADGRLWPPSIALTNADGFYEFTGLPAGDYTVDETQPAVYLDGKDTPGSTGGNNATNDVLRDIPLAGGANSVNNNFGERRGSISGFVYVDEGANGGTRDDGVKQPGEAAIAGVSVRLLRNGTEVARTVTDGLGAYRFDGLLLGGGYTVEEVTQPAGFDDGKDTAGTPGGGTAGNEVIANITLSQANPNSPNNNFGELVPAPARLSGFVYLDEGANGGVRDDGQKQAGEQGIAFATVSLFRVVNGQTNFVTQSLTNGVGFYEFTNLPAGTYVVREAQPAAFLDGKDTAGSTGGTVTNDQIATIPLVAGANSINNNFGELLPLGALSGFVYLDEGANGGTRDDGIKQAGEQGISGVSVTLFRVVNGVTTSLAQTVTNGVGFYRFANLPAGDGYFVRETQPAAFLDGKDTVGSTGGIVAANDLLAGLTVPSGGESVNNNFGELLPLGALSGFVYLDEGANGGVRDDGIKQSGEQGIAFTTVTLFRVVNGVTTSLAQTTTDGNGFYRFANLPAGDGYFVRETQPAAFLDGKDTVGSTGGIVAANDLLAGLTVPSGGESVNNNFGELLPPPRGAVSGFVYEDANDNGVKDPGEAGIPNAVVRLTNNLITLTTTTDATGFYRFSDLVPGPYAVLESQPAGFLDGKDTVGTTGGDNLQNDILRGVTAPAGGESVNNNFGELKPVSLFGFVWWDQNESATFDRNEPPIPGATVTLTGTTAGGQPISTALTNGNPLSVVTDANGRYSFPFLPAGNYTVIQTNTPAAPVEPFVFGDFASENAAGLSVSASTETSFTGVILNRDAGPLNFGKALIVSPPPPPNPQRPDPTKQNFLGSSGSSSTVPPVTPGQQVIAAGRTSRLLPAGSSLKLYAVGSGAGTPATVRVMDASTGSERFVIRPFVASFLGGVTTAVADVNADGTDDIIVAAGPGGGPHVKVFNGLTSQEMYSFYAYAPNFGGGVWLAGGDIDGDGYADIVTGAGAGGAPHVRAFSGRNLAEIASFYAFDTSITSGVRVAAGDFNGDRIADIAAATGAGVASQVATFSGRTLAPLSRLAPFESTFLGGVFLAAGDVNGDGLAEVIAGAGSGGAPRVKVMNALSGAAVYDFYAYTQTFGGGVRVASRDLNGDGKAEIITGLGAGEQPPVFVYSGANLAPLDSFYAFDSTNRNGIFVG
jgi:hypothetical protein